MYGYNACISLWLSVTKKLISRDTVKQINPAVNIMQAATECMATDVASYIAT